MNSNVASRKKVERWLSESTDLTLIIVLLKNISRQEYEKQ